MIQGNSGTLSIRENEASLVVWWVCAADVRLMSG